MTSYRRNFARGGTYFFTVNLEDRQRTLLTDHVDHLRTAFRYTRTGHSFLVDAIVVLPEHLHAIWTLPDCDSDYATRWRLIKSTFSRALPAGEVVSQSRSERGERGIWQRRHWEHTVRDERDFERHIHYIHYNPVKHGHVACVKDWPHSSFHRMVRLGIYSEDWGGDARDLGSAAAFGFGERQ
jgi:putative transposase